MQLYTLRSEKNWGIGDFGDLRAMLPEIARRGGSFIGLNPIHALYPANPESASPYSPSSRRWLNVIYIDVNAVEDFQRSEEAQAWWQSPATQQALQAARETDDVDYTAVTMLKMTALRMAWKQFSRREDEQMTAFREFVLREGKASTGRRLSMRCTPGRYNRTRCAGAGRPGRRPFRISTARR